MSTPNFDTLTEADVAQFRDPAHTCRFNTPPGLLATWREVPTGDPDVRMQRRVLQACKCARRRFHATHGPAFETWLKAKAESEATAASAREAGLVLPGDLKLDIQPVRGSPR